MLRLLLLFFSILRTLSVHLWYFILKYTIRNIVRLSEELIGFISSIMMILSFLSTLSFGFYSNLVNYYFIMLPGLYLPSLPTFPYHSSHYMQKCNWYHRIRSRKRCYYQYRIHSSAASSTSLTGICLLNRALSPISSLGGSLILNLLMTMVFMGVPYRFLY
mgnify:CR=1 FL=1